MLETVTGLPDNVVAFTAKGRLTRRDYDEVLIPAVDKALQRHAKIRCYYELGTQFSGMDAGAAWEDFKLGIGHLTRWEKVAVVTDVEWIRHTMNAFRFLMPGEIRVFPTTEAVGARAWIAAA
jgi:hypothetical protein